MHGCDFIQIGTQTNIYKNCVVSVYKRVSGKRIPWPQSSEVRAPSTLKHATTGTYYQAGAGLDAPARGKFTWRGTATLGWGVSFYKWIPYLACIGSPGSQFSVRPISLVRLLDRDSPLDSSLFTHHY